MKNKLSDLNNHLFAELERLSDEELTSEELAKEIDRAKAISQISGQIVSNSALTLRAVELQLEYNSTNKGLAGLIGGE